MKKFAVGLSCLILFVAQTWAASSQISKPFYLLPRDETPKIEGNKNAQACLLRKNLPAHLNYMVSTVLPRGEQEAHELVKPHVLDGQKFYVGHDLSYADLFHFHLRYPLNMPTTSLSDFQNSSTYHLHYHSYEQLGLMILERLYQIRDLNDAQTKVWVDERILKETSVSTNISYDYSGSATKLSMLDKTQIARLVNLWNTSLGDKSPGIDYLSHWAETLNDRVKASANLEFLMRHRSVASHDDRFEIIRELDLPNIWQPFDIMFSKVEQNKEVAELIRGFNQRTGQTWLGNLEGVTGAYLVTDEAIRADSIETFDKILAAIEAGSDPLNTLKQTVLDVPSFTGAFVVGDKFVYAIKINLASYECP